MAGDKMNMPSFGTDEDLIDIEGTKVPKDEVEEYVKNNYKKKSESGFGVSDVMNNM